jgi:protein PhnA
MSENLPICPICSCEYTYELGSKLVCPECAHEWEPTAAEAEDTQIRAIKDSAGNVLSDGDTVTIIKDLKIKGNSAAVKVGTKVKNIRLIAAVDGHDIDAKVDGFGAMYLKSSIVRKVT